MESSSAGQIRRQPLVRRDRDLFLSLSRGTRPRARGRRAMAALTRLGDTDATVVHLLVVATGLGMDGMAAYLWLCGGALLSATVAGQLVKRLVRRPRPSESIAGLVLPRANPDAYSFPSGHATAAFALAVASAHVLPLLGVAELVLASGIASSRVYLGAHYPLDVATGIVLGSVVATGWATLVVGG